MADTAYTLSVEVAIVTAGGDHTVDASVAGETVTDALVAQAIQVTAVRAGCVSTLGS